MTWQEVFEKINEMSESQRQMQAIVKEPMWDEDMTIKELTIPAEDEVFNQPKITLE